MELLTEVRKLAGKIDTLLGQSKEILNTHEAAKFLGVSVSQIYRLSSEAKIPVHKAGGKKLSFFLRSELVEWIANDGKF